MAAAAASNATEHALLIDGVLGALDVPVSSATALLVAKVTAMVVLGVVSMLVGLLPIKLAKWMRWSSDSEVVKQTEGEEQTAPPTDSATLSLLLCGGGGVLLCTTLVQLLPEVRLQLLSLQRSGSLPETRVPAAELLLVAGFLTLYLVEELVHRHLHKAHAGEANAEAGNHGHSHGHGHSHVPAGVGGGGKGQLGTAARGLLVVLGLSVHELLEGLAVGLERSPARVWALFVAVASHKYVISFCVGVQLVGMGSKATFVCAYVGAFSFMSALGIALGMAATAGEGAAAGVTATLMQGVAAGTLLYVVFFEVLEPQRASRHAGIRQLLAVTAGFAAMFAIQLAVEAVSE